MKVFLREIDNSSFQENRSKLLFEDNFSNRKFGTISNELTDFFYIGWQSDLVAPQLTEISEGIYSIGIDQNFAIINLKDVEVLFKKELDYNFYNIAQIGNNVFIITELEVLRLSIGKWELTSRYPLPDFYTGIKFLESNRLEIQCAEGQQVFIDI